MPKLNCHREVCGDRREKQMSHGDNQDAHQMQVAFRRRNAIDDLNLANLADWTRYFSLNILEFGWPMSG